MNRKVIKLEAGGAVPAVDEIIDPDNVPLNLEDDVVTETDEDKDELILAGDDPLKKPAGKKPAGQGEDEDQGGKDNYEPVNHADYILTQLGYTNKQIDLGEGVIKDVADLSEAEQLEVLTGRFEDVVGYYQTKLNEIETNGGSFANEVESVLVQALRDNDYNLTDLVKIISENDPVALAKSASNEELVTKHLKSIYPDFSDEDIADELEGMAGTSRFDKLASKLRENLLGQKLGEGDLAKAIQNYSATQNTRLTTEFNQQKNDMVSYMSSFNEFGGLPVDDSIKNFLLSELVPESPEKDSNFLSGINSPERATRLVFLDKFHDQIVKGTADYYFELGKAEAEKLIGKFKEKPDTISIGNRFRKKTEDSKKKGKTSLEDSPIEM
jgi:hypothetical protein